MHMFHSGVCVPETRARSIIKSSPREKSSLGNQIYISRYNISRLFFLLFLSPFTSHFSFSSAKKEQILGIATLEYREITITIQGKARIVWVRVCVRLGRWFLLPLALSSDLIIITFMPTNPPSLPSSFPVPTTTSFL